MAASPLSPTRRPLTIGVLLALATVFFVWGSLAERSNHHDAASTHTATTAESATGGETSGEHTGESTATKASETGTETEYRPFGINLESDTLIAAAAIVSLVLAVLVALRPHRLILVAVIVVAVAFTVLEVVEAIHQLDVDETGLFVLAVIAGVLHATVALLAGRQVTETSNTALAAAAT